MKVKVKALINFNDLEAKEKREANKSEWIVSKERADFLLEHNAVEVIEEIKEEKPTEIVAEELLEDPFKDYVVEQNVKKSKKKKSKK